MAEIIGLNGAKEVAMFASIKYWYRYMSSGQITITKRWAYSQNSLPSRDVEVHRVALSTGGFIEFVRDDTPGTAYVRIHLGVQAHPHDLNETYKYVRYGSDVEMVWLLREMRTALENLMRTLGK